MRLLAIIIQMGHLGDIAKSNERICSSPSVAFSGRVDPEPSGWIDEWTCPPPRVIDPCQEYQEECSGCQATSSLSISPSDPPESEPDQTNLFPQTIFVSEPRDRGISISSDYEIITKTACRAVQAKRDLDGNIKVSSCAARVIAQTTAQKETTIDQLARRVMRNCRTGGRDHLAQVIAILLRENDLHKVVYAIIAAASFLVLRITCDDFIETIRQVWRILDPATLASVQAYRENYEHPIWHAILALYTLETRGTPTLISQLGICQEIRDGAYHPELIEILARRTFWSSEATSKHSVAKCENALQVCFQMLAGYPPVTVTLVLAQIALNGLEDGNLALIQAFLQSEMCPALEAVRYLQKHRAIAAI